MVDISAYCDIKATKAEKTAPVVSIYCDFLGVFHIF